jgi:hypothetical protein
VEEGQSRRETRWVFFSSLAVRKLHPMLTSEVEIAAKKIFKLTGEFEACSDIWAQSDNLTIPPGACIHFSPERDRS